MKPSLLLQCSLISSLAASGCAADTIAPNDGRLVYSDCARVQVSEQRAVFDRIIEAGAGIGHDAPGARIRFRTDAARVEARFRYNALHLHPARSGAGAILLDGKKAATFNSPAVRPGMTTAVLQLPAGRKFHEVEVVLPYADSVDFEGLTISEGATVQAAPPRPTIRYVAYGDSITQGYSGTDATNSYPFLIAEARGWQCINMGFGGRDATATDGAVLGTLGADIITIAIGFNDHRLHKPLDAYRKDLAGIIAGVRAAQKDVPIFVLTPLWSTEPYKSNLGLKLEDYRTVVRSVVAESNDAALHCIEGMPLVTNEGKYFPDGVHPNDAGFAEMASRLEKLISTRKSEKQP